jgi:hypothetical protein
VEIRRAAESRGRALSDPWGIRGELGAGSWRGIRKVSSRYLGGNPAGAAGNEGRCGRGAIFEN